MPRKKKSSKSPKSPKNIMEQLAEKFVKESETIGVEVLNDQPNSGNIGTGSYVLNSIISGSIFKGIPDNKTIALCGPSNTGKSFILAQIVKNAQDEGFLPIIFDSERAVDREYYQRIGANTKAMVRYPVGTHMEFRNQAYLQINQFMSKHPNIKLFIGLDSLGNLAGDKEMADAEKGKSAADMGTSAKQMNSAFRVVNNIVSKFNFPFVFTNHVYDDPSQMFASRGRMSGGAKAIYNSHIIIYFSKAQLKEEVKDEGGKKKEKKIGLYMNAVTIKNRIVPEEQKAQIEVRYREGVQEFFGLLNYGLGAGVFEKIKGKNGIYVKHLDKQVSTKKFYTSDVFTPDVLNAIDAYVRDKHQYSTYSESEIDEIEEKILEVK